jgi:hypothetical protein
MTERLGLLFNNAALGAANFPWKHKDKIRRGFSDMGRTTAADHPTGALRFNIPFAESARITLFLKTGRTFRLAYA